MTKWSLTSRNSMRPTRATHGNQRTVTCGVRKRPQALT
ncbi:hypothetical protein Y027_3848 [Burkholderia pseudomallei TSV5]|nr:hypothetical protein DP44_4912 [Burkholderia pseudomallei]KGX55908.1 hypothetical protein Y027_3848 [Burkholderia pseudomallei TSV5]KGX56490.1 hypothetical protein Y025_3846 [Burkholderia pseudomallei TSV32]KGX67690.1 hypothetical protein Y026_5470 [Burkholderia pseudomallei TSV28]